MFLLGYAGKNIVMYVGNEVIGDVYEQMQEREF